MFAEVLRAKLAGTANLTDQQVAQLQSHYDLMMRWNRSLNLTTITDLEEAVERHYCESIFLAVHLPSAPLTIADVGSGPGFPGFPVAIVRPDCKITLVESHRRKAVFLKEASRKVPNVSVLPQRAEEVRATFGLVISRAVSFDDLKQPLKVLAPAADLLTGAEVPDFEGWNWDPPIPLPWGRSRFLLRGRVAE